MNNLKQSIVGRWRRKREGWPRTRWKRRYERKKCKLKWSGVNDWKGLKPSKTHSTLHPRNSLYPNFNFSHSFFSYCFFSSFRKQWFQIISIINFPYPYSFHFHVDFFFFSLIALNHLFLYFLHLPLAIFSTARPHLYVKLCLNWIHIVLFFSIDHIVCWISKSQFLFLSILLLILA